MKNILILIAIVLVGAISPNTLAKSENDVETARSMLSVMLTGELSVDRSLFLLTAAGASDEALKSIAEDFRGQQSASPKMDVDEHDRIMFNGRFSGLEIKSYSPMQVVYNGSYWKYDKSKSMDRNYFAFKSFLEGKVAVSRFELLFGQKARANGIFSAADALSSGEKYGTLAAFAGLICLVVEPCGLYAAGGILLTAGVLTAMDGFISPAAAREFNRAVLDSKNQLTCDSNKIGFHNGDFSYSYSKSKRVFTGNLDRMKNRSGQVKTALKAVGKKCSDQACCDKMLTEVRELAARGLDTNKNLFLANPGVKTTR